MPSPIDVEARDPERSRIFYCEVFGLSCRVVAEDADRAWNCRPRDTNGTITQMSFRIHRTPRNRSSRKNQRRTIRIELDSSTLVNRAYIRAATRGYETTLPTIVDGQWQIVIIDPDGNELQLHAPL